MRRERRHLTLSYALTACPLNEAICKVAEACSALRRHIWALCRPAQLDRWRPCLPQRMHPGQMHPQARRVPQGSHSFCRRHMHSNSARGVHLYLLQGSISRPTLLDVLQGNCMPSGPLPSASVL